jgi:hypothetical protein
MMGRDVSLPRVKAADCFDGATRARLMLGRPASKQWNQAPTDELGNGQPRFGGERLESLSLVIGQLNLRADHLTLPSCVHSRHYMIASFGATNRVPGTSARQRSFATTTRGVHQLRRTGREVEMLSRRASPGLARARLLRDQTVSARDWRPSGTARKCPVSSSCIRRPDLRQNPHTLFSEHTCQCM